MNAHCAPAKAQLLAEDQQKEFTGQTSSSTRFAKSGVETSTSASQENYVYLHFSCPTGSSATRTGQ